MRRNTPFFIVQQAKWISAATNVVGSGSLSDWTANGQKYKQMSEEWIFVAGVTKGLNNHKQLGAKSGLPLNDIVIIEQGVSRA